MSDKKPPPTPLSPSTVSSSAPKSREESIASVSLTSPQIDKDQLAQALDKIHISAKEKDVLTTFNDFAPPPESIATTESKGIGSDLVQNGLSGLYSRFKEAVGVSGKEKLVVNTNTKENSESIDGDTASKKSSSTTTTGPKPSTSLLRADTGATCSTFNSSQSEPMTSTIASSSAAPTSESQSQQSQQPQSTMASSVTNLTGVMTSKSASSSRQSIPNMTKATAAVAPVHVSAFKDGSRGTSAKTEDSASRGCGRSISRSNDGQHIPNPELSSIYDAPGNKRASNLDKIAIPSHSRREDGLIVDEHTDTPISPIKRSNVMPPISTAPNSTSPDSYIQPQPALLSAKDAIRRPALIDRISYSRASGDLSRSSSLSRGTTEHSPINTSAHNSVHHESFAQIPSAQRIRSGEYRIPGTTTDEGAPEIVNAKLASMRKQVLSKDFWMADETCKECFLCGAPFTAFRRKHHCRTCGCIFDSGCTSIISGQRFGVQGTLRVCKPCLGIILQRQDGAASDDSADDSFLPAIFRSGQSKRGYSPFSKMDRDDASISERTDDLDDDKRSLTAPMMAIPVARRIGESSNRNSAVLEIGTPQLSRPSSSRSLKSNTSGRPQSSSHRRHHSKHNLWNRLKPSPDQRAPFRKSATEEASKKTGLHAFHDDNVIDPDLAPFMSDESSGDEQMSIAGAIAGSEFHASPATDPERSSLAYLNAGRKLRTRAQTDKSISGVSFTSRGLDDFHPRSSRRRNMSIASGHHVRSPRPKSAVIRGPTGSNETLPAIDTPGGSQLPRLTRSSSMKGDKEPRLELNPASLLHVRKLLRQLLEDSNVPNVSAWEKALMPILLKCTSSVDPDIDRGDDIDIRHYVKLKKIPGGRPSDTCYVSGVIFTKKLALKSMPRRMSTPRVVIVSFPIEYQRHQQQFMSLQPVIEQEREFLKQLVNRIIALRPQLLLAEKSVSGLALQFLSDAKISVAYNVKPSVLSAVSRCLETEIISSVDMLALPPHQFQTGKSTGYEVKTFVNEDIPGRKKTYIFLSSYLEDLGCTIALRGASTPILAKLKHITEFMVYVVYNLKLESCLMRDSFIQIPTDEDISRDSTQTTDSSQPSLPTKAAIDDDAQKSLLSITQDEIPSSQEDHSPGNAIEVSQDSNVPQDQPLSIQPASQLISLHETHSQAAHESSVPEDVPMPTFYSDMVAKYQTRILSVSPFVKFAKPYLLMKAREQERKLAHLKRLRDQDVIEERVDNEKSNPPKFQLIKPQMVLETGHNAPRQIMEILHAVHDAEYDRALYNYQTQTRQWENYIKGNIGFFEPYAHQNIVVLHSVICTETKIPCSEPNLIALGFYDEHVDRSSGMDPDCTLGQYIEDICYGADSTCEANGCDRKLYEHHRTYVHGEARITIFIEQDTGGRLHGDNIMMWSYCKHCKRETSEIEMSRGTWKYSFGKYLELSFWSRGTTLVRDEDLGGWNCPHDHHRDHIRYFGLNGKVVRIHYDPIDLLEIIVPRARITWNVGHDLNMKNEIFTNAQERWTRFTTSVKSRLKAINTDNIIPEKAEPCKAEMERLSKRIHDDHTSLIRKLQDKYMESKYYEVIPFNIVLREMLVKVAEWDAAFAKFEADFLPSDKDIRKLTMIHLRKMFTDESKESLNSNEVQNEATDITDETGTQTNMPESDHKQDTQQSEANTDTSQLDVIQEKNPLDVPPQEETLERIEPLDLATPKSPVPSSSAPSQPDNHVGTLEVSVPNVTDAVSALSPELVPRLATSTVPPMSLTEQVEQLRRRQHSLGPESTSTAGYVGNERAGTAGESQKTPERSSSRRIGLNVSPPMVRAISHPVNSIPTLPRLHSTVGKKMFNTNKDKDKDKGPFTEVIAGSELRKAATSESAKSEKKLFSSLRPHRKGNQSSIPRFVGKKDSRVSTIRKHFEQLSREFEKEREKDREKRKLRMSHSRPFLQHSTTKAIVEVYEDVDEAVQEPGPAEDEHATTSGLVNLKLKNKLGLEGPPPGNEAVEAPTEDMLFPKDGHRRQDEIAIEGETDDQAHNNSLGPTDDEQGESDTEHSLIDGTTLEEIAESFDSNAEIPIELPKQDKNNFMKVLTTFWNERSASQWPPLDYPLNAADHIFIDSDIIVREDEPSSLIAFALSSEDYKEKLRTFYRKKDGESVVASAGTDTEDDAHSEVHSDIGENVTESQLETKLVHTTSSHYKYQFTEGTAKMLVKIFYAEQFDALRRKCGVADRIIESLSRCLKWDSKGGKTKSVFLKTQDDRLVMKSLSPVETAAFLKFAPAYFGLMAEALFHDLPSVIAKMLGFFQVIIKNPVTNTEIKLDLLLMENLFYDRAPTRIFDLKGSMRNRKIQSTGERNEVLLDENMVDYIYESPLFAREHSKKTLRDSVWNDTLFLARQNVMDYSLMIAVDEIKKELVVGIIDCIRTYTWDKKLESWIKDRGFAGGGRNKPTVTSPKEYKSRFREAMARYILEAPNCWHQPSAPLPVSRPPRAEMNAARRDEVATDVGAT